MSSFPSAGRVYTVNFNSGPSGTTGITVATAITLIQIKAGALNPLWILRASLGQDNSITNSQERVRIVRKSAAATMTTAVTPLAYDSDDGAAKAVGSTTGTGILATAEGTDGDILLGRTFSVLNGFEWIATPMEMMKVPAGGIIALKFPVAPASQLWTGQIVFCES